MKKILILLLFSAVCTNVCVADYRRAAEFVRAGNYPDAVDALQDTLASDPKSQYLMGYLYYHGLGVEQNYNQAADLFEKALEAGNIESATFLAYMYDEGKGIGTNKKRAFDLYQMASEAGDVTATMNLAVMYYSGSGIPQNYDRAFALMDSIENARDPVVQFYLGNFYFYGYGVKTDQKRAVAYYIRAAQLGSVEAHYMLGYIYKNGYGVAADPKKALKYYEYAAYAQQPQAQYNLASMYADGSAGGVDMIRAYAWFTKAVDNNVEAASQALSKVADAMDISEISRAKQFLIGLNRQLASKELVASESLNENLGDKAFKTPARPANAQFDFPTSQQVTGRTSSSSYSNSGRSSGIVSRRRNVRRR